MLEREAVLGVNLCAGIAYLGLVNRPSRIDHHEPRKVAPPTNVDEWTELQQFGERVLTEARARHAVAVVFVEPQKFGGWKYYEAHRRGALQTAVGLALRSTEVRMVALAQKTIAAAFDCRGTKELNEKLPTLLDLDPQNVLHWKERGLALAAALCYARKLWP